MATHEKYTKERILGLLIEEASSLQEVCWNRHSTHYVIVHCKQIVTLATSLSCRPSQRDKIYQIQLELRSMMGCYAGNKPYTNRTEHEVYSNKMDSIRVLLEAYMNHRTKAEIRELEAERERSKEIRDLKERVSELEETLDENITSNELIKKEVAKLKRQLKAKSKS